MRHIIQYNISKGENQYVAEGVNLPAVTQAPTLDELVENIKEVTALLLEGENPATYGLATHSSVLLNIEIPQACYA